MPRPDIVAGRKQTLIDRPWNTFRPLVSLDAWQFRVASHIPSPMAAAACAERYSGHPSNPSLVAFAAWLALHTSWPRLAAIIVSMVVGRGVGTDAAYDRSHSLGRARRSQWARRAKLKSHRRRLHVEALELDVTDLTGEAYVQRVNWQQPRAASLAPPPRRASLIGSSRMAISPDALTTLRDTDRTHPDDLIGCRRTALGPGRDTSASMAAARS